MKQYISQQLMITLSSTLDNKFTLLLFDGNCASCDYLVNFILKKDSCQQFLFAPLQSTLGHSISKSLGLNPYKVSTLILIHKQTAYTHSSAVFKIIELLGPPLNRLLIFSYLPVPVSDFLYSIFAKSRYRLFGHLKSCRLYSPEERRRFIKDLPK